MPFLLTGVALRVAEEPLQMVWFGNAVMVMLGELTVTTAELVAVAVHNPSTAETVTV